MAQGLSDTQVSAILEAGLSPRAMAIDTWQRYVDGSIYNGRPDFFDDECGRPLSKRKPCVIYMGVKSAITSYSTLCLGEGRFPVISSAPSEDDSVFDDRLGLNESQSNTLDTGILKIAEQTRLDAVSQQLLEAAMGSGSVAVLVSVSSGKLKVSSIDAKCCEPEFDENDPDRVERLVVSYRYTTRERDPQDGKWKTHCWQYRRVIDDQFDITYKPVEIFSDKEFPQPSAEKTKYRHGFGFCPVRWYRFCWPVSAENEIDGKPIHGSPGILSLIDAINLSLSQRHRAAVYCGDPQIVETGVEDADARFPMTGASPSQEADISRDRSGWGQPLSGQARSGRSSEQKRKKGAGTVWRYESADSKVHYLTLAGDSLKWLDEDARDNIKKLREDLGHVHIDPETLTGSGDISGKTLSFVFATQIAKCNKIREDFWRMCLQPVLGMLLRVALKISKGLYLPGADKLRSVLARFEQTVDGASSPAWFDPQLKPQWGEYFEPSDIDESTRIANAKLAKDAGLITLESAVRHIQPIFKDIQNTAQYVDALQNAADEAESKLHDAMTALGGANGSQPRGQPKPQPGRGAPPAPGARGGRPAPAAQQARQGGPARSASSAT